ncbi:MAG: hypothetical protein U0794_00740 [Isosphaeraceae bacterium]
MTSTIRTLAIASLAMVATNAWGQTPLRTAADDRPALQVGEKAPGFTLRDQEGRERKLGDLLAKGTVALVFYRSADW